MIEVRPLSDPEAIDAILRHPSVAGKVRHDGREPGYIDHPLVSYHGAYVDRALVGVFVAIRFSRWEAEVHAALLPRATRQGRALGLMFLDAVFADPEVLRCTGYVLSTLPSAANYCRKLGFEHEGTRRSACMVGGQVVDVLVMGLVRSVA